MLLPKLRRAIVRRCAGLAPGPKSELSVLARKGDRGSSLRSGALLEEGICASADDLRKGAEGRGNWEDAGNETLSGVAKGEVLLGLVRG